MKRLILLAIVLFAIPAYGENGVPMFPSYLDRQLPYVQVFIVDVKINGYPFRMIFDTGASHTLLNISSAHRAGLTVEKSDIYREEIGLANGSKSWALVFISNSIEVQGIKQGKLKIWAINQEEDGVDGLLGRDFLYGTGGVVLSPDGHAIFLQKERR